MQDISYDITDEQVRELDRRVHAALEKRSISDLNTLGFGELGVPLAWPDDAPSLCVKRLIGTKKAADGEFLFGRIRQYVDALEPFMTTLPTELRMVTDDAGRHVTWLIQPILPKEQLVETILGSSEPERDHPVVVAVRDACVGAIDAGRAAPDSQFSNFAWDDNELTFFDVGTPFMFHPDGSFDEGFGATLNTMPALLRPIGKREACRIGAELGGRRGNLEHAAISIDRMGLDDWLQAVVDTFNDVLDEPLAVADIRERTSKRHKDMVQLKNIMKVQRAWATKVRRQPYDFFITDSWTGEII